MLSQLCSALQLLKKTPGPHFEKPWQTDRRNSLQKNLLSFTKSFHSFVPGSVSKIVYVLTMEPGAQQHRSRKTRRSVKRPLHTERPARCMTCRIKEMLTILCIVPGISLDHIVRISFNRIVLAAIPPLRANENMTWNMKKLCKPGPYTPLLESKPMSHAVGTGMQSGMPAHLLTYLCAQETEAYT